MDIRDALLGRLFANLGYTSVKTAPDNSDPAYRVDWPHQEYFGCDSRNCSR